ncbi:MAG: (d)CMP kinase [Clostridiales bacterium]|nr:(d)CMP kinase [Clostridiales bacterium]
MIVAIDGPAGSGKGTITEIVSKELNLINISSGGAYRCVALLAIENNIEIWQKEKILDVLNSSTIEFKNENGKDVIFLNGKDVTNRIKENDVANIVSQISSIKEVRFKLNEIFRQCAKGKNVIMEGRDIGTYVFPNADVKLYLDASEEIRAKRRVRQNKEQGIETNYEEVLENLRFRDKNDREKEVGALKQAEDAVYINSDNMTPQQEADEVIKVIKSKVKGL